MGEPFPKLTGIESEWTGWKMFPDGYSAAKSTEALLGQLGINIGSRLRKEGEKRFEDFPIWKGNVFVTARSAPAQNIYIILSIFAVVTLLLIIFIYCLVSKPQDADKDEDNRDAFQRYLNNAPAAHDEEALVEEP